MPSNPMSLYCMYHLSFIYCKYLHLHYWLAEIIILVFNWPSNWIRDVKLTICPIILWVCIAFIIIGVWWYTCSCRCPDLLDDYVWSSNTLVPVVSIVILLNLWLCKYWIIVLWCCHAATVSVVVIHGGSGVEISGFRVWNRDLLVFYFRDWTMLSCR